MKTKEELLKELPHFTGSEYCHEYICGYRVTRGAKWFAKAVECYWLLGTIASTHLLKDVSINRFQVHKFLMNRNKQKVVYMINDKDGNRLHTQTFGFTVFPLGEITLWVVDKIIMLPSEYKKASIKPLFKLGRIVVTPGAIAYAKQHSSNFDEILYRHEHGDGGTLDPEDVQSNQDAIERGDSRVFSCYNVGPDRLWIITE